jgi:hypothetical protein
LPLIIFWNAATGHPQFGADFAFAMASPFTTRLPVRARYGHRPESP